MVVEYLKLIRIHQWHKNSFVLLGFFLLGDYRTFDLFLKSSITTLSFCLASSSVYIFNDYRDVAFDRSHPRKKARPLAAQTIKIAPALWLSATLLLSSLTLAYYISIITLAIISTYVLNNLVYTLISKRLVIIDVFQIAIGFMLRIFAGTTGIDIYISEWLVITGFMISLLIGFSKRFAELTFSRNPHSQREVLQFYSEDPLKVFVIVMASATIATYAIYTLSPRALEIHGTKHLIYTTPIVLFGILRFLYLLFTQKTADDSTNHLFMDKQLLFAVVVWALTYGLLIS